MGRDRAGAALGQAGGPERSAQLRAWLDAIGEFTRAVNRGMPSQDLLNLVAGTVAHLTGYDFCAVMLPDEDGERLLIRGSYGLLASYVAEVNVAQVPLIRPGALAEGPSSRAFRSQRPVVLVDICADPACLQWESLAREQGYRSILSLPLVGSQGALGVLNCYAPQPREFPAHEVVLMETVANQAALAIESSVLRERERARSRDLARRVESLEDELRITQRLSAEFLDDLLSADPRGDLAAPHTVIVVRPDPADDNQVVRAASGTSRQQRSLLTQVQRAVNEAGAGCGALVAGRGENVIVLWPQRDDGPSAAELAERLCRHNRVYGEGPVSVSLGSPCHDASEYADAYRLADSVLDLSQRAGSRDRVVALEDLGVYRLLLQVKRPAELIRLMHSVLGPLHDYDSRHDTALVETVRTFLGCGFSTAATAEAMIVHPNTIGYRLRRIEELLGMDCHDPQVLLQFQLAFMIERIVAASG